MYGAHSGGSQLNASLLPREHIVDAAYIDAELLVKSAQEHHITLVGPARPKAGWQNKVAGAYGYDQFTVDWERKQVRCPQGKWSLPWRERRDPSRDPWFAAHFRTQDCAAVSDAQLVYPLAPPGPVLQTLAPGHSTKRCNRRAPLTPPRPDRNAMRGGRALKGPSHKVFALLAHGAHAIAGYPRPICNR